MVDALCVENRFSHARGQFLRKPSAQTLQTRKAVRGSRYGCRRQTDCCRRQTDCPVMISAASGFAWMFALLSLIGAAYSGCAALLVQRFAKRSGPLPDPCFPVTLLKPLYGEEPASDANLT